MTTPKYAVRLVGRAVCEPPRNWHTARTLSLMWSEAVALPEYQHVALDDAGLESNRVIGLRIAKLMRAGKAAQREARRMAAVKASTSLMAGESQEKIIKQYRRKVAANAKRLSRTRTRRKRKSIWPLADQQSRPQPADKAVGLSGADAHVDPLGRQCTSLSAPAITPMAESPFSVQRPRRPFHLSGSCRPS